ncbi:MAG: YceD family protein [Prolixibacteraceae bacterium]
MAGWKSKYDLEFKGLKEGLHEFSFEAGEKFFEHFENSPVNVGDVQLDVTLEKRSTFLKIYLKLKGRVELTCDRCLGEYRQKIKNKAEVLVKFSELEQEDDVDVMWVFPDEHRLNLSQLIYEYIALAIPLKRVHPDKENGESGCDPEMLNKLDDYVQPGNEADDEENIDPRWEALRKLKNNN